MENNQSSLALDLKQNGAACAGDQSLCRRFDVQYDDAENFVTQFRVNTAEIDPEAMVCFNAAAGTGPVSVVAVALVGILAALIAL